MKHFKLHYLLLLALTIAAASTSSSVLASPSPNQHSNNEQDVTETTILEVPVGASIQDALDRAAEVGSTTPSSSSSSASPSSKRRIIVRLAPGVHRLPAPLNITSRHSGLTLQGAAVAGAPPKRINESSFSSSLSILDGSVPLPPFTTSSSNGTWVTSLPLQNFTAENTPTTLLIGGTRRTRARSPNILTTQQMSSSSLSPPPPPLIISSSVTFSPPPPPTLDQQYTDASTFHVAAPLAACSAPAWGSCPAVDKLGFIYNATEQPLSGGGPVNPHTNWTQGGVLALLFASWTAEWVGVAQAIESNTSLMFNSAVHTAIGTYGVGPGGGKTPAGGRFVLENAREFLDAPGEWYASPLPDGRVWYMPLAGETLESVEASAAVLPTLINIQGDVGEFSLQGVELRGWGEWKPDARVGEAQPSSFGAIMITGNAVNTTIFNVTIHAGATNGVVYGSEVYGLILDHILVFDAGGSGVGALYDNNYNATDVVISNCTIWNVGNVYVAQPVGIAAAGAARISVLHNEVYDVAYAGIMAVQPGGGQPPSSSVFTDTQQPIFDIGYNRVTNYGMGVLNDFGAIYVAVYGDCWISNTCYLPVSIHHNLLMSGRSYNYGANGIYTDQALSGAWLHHNILADVGAVAIEAHCGLGNAATNNVVYAPQQQSATNAKTGAFGGCNSFGFPPGLNSTFNFTLNIVSLNATDYLVDSQFPPPDNDYITPASWTSDNNVFFFFGSGPDAPLLASSLHYPNNTIGLAQWRQAWGQDLQSVEDDPLLADPANGNFTVLPASPAWALGWEEVDGNEVGPVGG